MFTSTVKIITARLSPFQTHFLAIFNGDEQFRTGKNDESDQQLRTGNEGKSR